MGATPSHARSRAQEAETATRTGGNLVHRSGAGLVKGDVRKRGLMRVENKTTKYKSFGVNEEHIAKLLDSVAGTTEIPFMQIELNSGNTKFIVIPDIYFDDIIKALDGETD